MKKDLPIGTKVKIVSEGSRYNGRVGKLGAQDPDGLPAYNVWFDNDKFDCFMDDEFLPVQNEECTGQEKCLFVGELKHMTMKEKVENILGGFWKRNSDYAIHAYIRNGITGNFMTNLLIPVKWNVQAEEKQYLIKWKVGDVECNDLSLPYDEIMDCYEETDEYNQQNVVVIMKNGMKLEFECCGFVM